MKQKIVCFSGQMAAGKDEAANFLAAALSKDSDIPWNRTAFAAAVKSVLVTNFGLSREFIEEWKRKDEPPEGFQQTIRKALQFIGDGFRQIKPSVWIDALYMFHPPESGHLVISDGRYLTEVESVRVRNGLNVAVWRPGFENDNPHPSESQVKPYIDKLKKLYPSGGEVIDKDIPFDYFLVNRSGLGDLAANASGDLANFVRQYFSSAQPITDVDD